MQHPEGGHIILKSHPEDTYKGHCPYHGTCLEGMANGPAIEDRWGKKGVELADNPKVWEFESYYIAQALVDYIMVLSPQKIILGGGVMHQEHMLPLIHKKTKELLNGYINTREIEQMDKNSMQEDWMEQGIQIGKQQEQQRLFELLDRMRAAGEEEQFWLLKDNQEQLEKKYREYQL